MRLVNSYRLLYSYGYRRYPMLNRILIVVSVVVGSGMTVVQSVQAEESEAFVAQKAQRR